MGRSAGVMIGQILLAVSRSFGGDIEWALRNALSDGAPKSGDYREVDRYFGKDAEIIAAILDPFMAALDEIIPGFKRWVMVSGYANDKDFILALLKWQQSLVKPTSGERVKIMRGIADQCLKPAAAA
jgi:hypothetical protein